MPTAVTRADGAGEPAPQSERDPAPRSYAGRNPYAQHPTSARPCAAWLDDPAFPPAAAARRWRDRRDGRIHRRIRVDASVRGFHTPPKELSAPSWAQMCTTCAQLCVLHLHLAMKLRTSHGNPASGVATWRLAAFPRGGFASHSAIRAVLAAMDDGGGRGAAAARAEARHAAVGAAGARQAARARQQGVLQPLPLPKEVSPMLTTSSSSKSEPPRCKVVLLSCAAIASSSSNGERETLGCLSSCHNMSCHTMSCHTMSCHNMSCHTMSFDVKHADVTLPVQQQSQQGQAVSPSAGQPQRNMWSRPDMALQYGGLSLVKCMQLFLPPGLLHTPTPSDVSPEQTPEFNPPPAAVTTAAGRGHAVAAAAGVAATAPQQSTTAASLTAHQLARILFPNSHATDSHPMDRGLKRLRNDDTGVSTGAAHTAGMREGLSARQREDIEAIDASAVRSLLLRPADSQSHHHQCDSRPTIPTSWLLALLLQQNQQQKLHQQHQEQHEQQQKQQPSLFTQDPINFKSTQSSQSLHGPSLFPAAQCSSTPTLGSLPALDWPLSFATSLSPSITPSFASSISPSSPAFCIPLFPTPLCHLRPSLLPPLPLPLPLITPNNPLTAPPSSIPSPSSHCQSAAPFTPTSPETAAAPLVPSAPSTVINCGPPHSLPTFPSLFALQSALHTPPVKAPPTLSDPSHQKPSQHNPSQNHLSQRYPSRSASPSNAASSASVDCSPPSSQTSSQPSFQHVFQCTAGAVESQQLQAMRPHKMPRTSHGVLPLAALEFARSFFSGLPGRDDHQGGESSDGQKTLEPACTSARQDSRLSGGNAETQYGCVGGGAATELPPKACQPSLPEIVSAAAAAPGVSAATAVTGTPDVDSPAAAALAAAAEGIRQGDVSIWKDFIELEGEAEEVVCSVEKRTGLTVGTFCELEELFEETGTLM
ncbi:unnamed protein product [Closterium sp. NIES-54]